MGCVSSTLLNHDDDFSRIGGSNAFGHHIVSLTSTTYGLLTLDPPPSAGDSSDLTTTIAPKPTPRFTLGSFIPSPLPSDPKPLKPEIINSWELMAGLDSNHISDHSFRFTPIPLKSRKENSNPNIFSSSDSKKLFDPSPPSSEDAAGVAPTGKPSPSLDDFEMLCPPNGENKIVLYTTTLRGIRKTFEACNSVRSAISGLGFQICERDTSMDRRFKDELRQLMKGKESLEPMIPPRVFVKGRYVGGVEEVMRMLEEGVLSDLLREMPKLKSRNLCEGCGGVRFLPCFQCNGSCKVVVEEEDDKGEVEGRAMVVVRCSDCNENGLIICPICS